MAIPRQVTCIKKVAFVDRHDTISFIGGPWGMITQNMAITEIERRISRYYVKINNIDAKVIVSEYRGKKYLKTESEVDILLTLPSCN